MKRQIFFLLLLMAIIGCSSLSEEQKIAKQFLTGYYNYDFEAIYPISTPKTELALKEIQQRIGGKPAKGSYTVPIVEILECYKTDSVTYCRYRVLNDKNDETAQSDNLQLVKIDGKWKVNYFIK